MIETRPTTTENYNAAIAVPMPRVIVANSNQTITIYSGDDAVKKVADMMPKAPGLHPV